MKRKPYVRLQLSGNKYFLVYLRKKRRWEHVYLRELVEKKTPSGKSIYRYENIERVFSFKLPKTKNEFSYESLRWQHDNHWIERNMTLRVLHDYHFWEYPPGQWRFGGVWK